MLKFLMDEKTLVFLTYLGVFLTTYYSIRVRHKKIKYIIMRKGEKYLVAFWNACSQTIFREDIHHLYCVVNVNCLKTYAYSTDPDINLEFELGEDFIDSYRGKLFNRHTRRMELKPDFIRPKSGILVELDNQQKNGYLFANLLLFGRIRGEKQSSVHWITPLDISIVKNPKELFRIFFSVILFAVSVVPLLLVFFGVPDLLMKNLAEHFGITALFLSVFSLLIGLTGYNIYINSAPKDIKRKIHEYKNDGYHEVSMYYY